MDNAAFQKQIDDHFKKMEDIFKSVRDSLNDQKIFIKNYGYMAGNIMLMDFAAGFYPKAKSYLEQLQKEEDCLKSARINYYDKKRRIGIILQ